ncbi:MAG TPA: hypothetical protein VD811_02905 [Desulfuromonadales bacterium]|nr:hypothetical protein [Desulfuromonadales bacterium]
MSRLARSHGLLDPVKLLSRLESFGQPLAVKEPLELLRAGLIFHARGLLNTGAIQHNLDWIWPFWVERQYNPHDDAFIPRAFSITHVNLTHRNWTAVGLPDLDAFPIVDPRGLLTPFWDGWSLDGWLVTEGGRWLVPSQLDSVAQHLDLEDGPAVVTRGVRDGLQLITRSEVIDIKGAAVCRLTLTARSDRDAWLVAALRPYNPEGVSFVHDIRPEPDGSGWRLDRHRLVRFASRPDRCLFSDYRQGDVHTRLFAGGEQTAARCAVGMATAAALFAVPAGGPRQVRLEIPLESRNRPAKPLPPRPGWAEAMAGAAAVRLPDARFQSLYDAALRTLVLHSPGEVYPGPYTYKRFWFRDAAFILHALLCTGLTDRVERVLDTFPSRQKASGFFLSQEGEWDSNGEALWIMHRFCQLAGRPPKSAWRPAIRRGCRWIRRQRLAAAVDLPHAGLFPAGFSAEHLGPNDFYYWDDFWGVAGLRAGAALLDALGDREEAKEFRLEAGRFLTAIERSLAGAAERLGRPAMPASPYRRLDSGAVGSLAAGYPLALFPADDPRLLDSAKFLLERCLVGGGFYQDIIHSGINPYLTLHLAQVLLRAGDRRCFDLLRSVAALASPTGQWPEAIHPRTRGGCMGDGHHVWAAAEWVLMLRNCFLQEAGDRLVLAAGICPEWLEQEGEISFGPAPTPFGTATVAILPRGEEAEVRWSGTWRTTPPPIEVALPGCAPLRAEGNKGSVLVDRRRCA